MALGTFAAMRGLLATENVTESDAHDDGHGDGHHEKPFTFEDLIYLCLLLWAIWISGKLANRVCLPPLVGEICAGMICGPHLLNFAPKHTALMLFGEVGLVMMVLEAGIEVDLSMLSLVGPRGVCVAVCGTLGPLAIAFLVMYLGFDMELKSALAVGASLSPTSMGISLKVLQEANVLTTPTGQLIITAAVIDDVIALILLSELEALEEPTVSNFAIPIVASLGFIVVVGLSAVKIIPGVLSKHVVPNLPSSLVEPTLLGFVLLAGMGLMTACYYGESSHLLGAFLGGLCFCTLHTVEHVWRVRVSNILNWLVKIFFACSVGFEVPIKDLWEPRLLTKAACLLLAAFGKFGTGAFASPFNKRDAITIGAAMAAWGEFAFIVATASREAGTLDDETYGAVILAVLVSAFYSPVILSFTLGKGKEDKALAAASEEGEHMFIEDNPVDLQAKSDKGLQVYYVCSVRCRNYWGLMDRLMKGICKGSRDVDIVDFRLHTNLGWTLFEIYLCERNLPNGPESSLEKGRDITHGLQIHVPSDVELGVMGGEVVDLIQGRCTFFKELLEDLSGIAQAHVAANERRTVAGQDNVGSEDFGEVIVEQWCPAAQACTDGEDYDSQVFKQAELCFHEEYAEESTLNITSRAAKTRQLRRRMSLTSLDSVPDQLLNDSDKLLHMAVQKARDDVIKKKESRAVVFELLLGQGVAGRKPGSSLETALNSRRASKRSTIRATSRAAGGALDSTNEVSDVISPLTSFQNTRRSEDGSPKAKDAINNVEHNMITVSGASGSQLAVEVKKQLSPYL